MLPMVCSLDNPDNLSVFKQLQNITKMSSKMSSTKYFFLTFFNIFVDSTE